MIFYNNDMEINDMNNSIHYFIPNDLDIDDKDNNIHYFIPKDLDIDDKDNNINYSISKDLDTNNKLEHIKEINIKQLLNIPQLVIFSIVCDINFNDFLLLFDNVMNNHYLFKTKRLDLNLRREYYDTCQFLYLLEFMIIIEDNTLELKKSYFFKVIDNVPIIYDENIFKNNNKSKKNKDELLKGYLLYKSLDDYLFIKIMTKYFNKMKELKRILNMIILNDIEVYKSFRISNLLEIMVNILFMKNNFNAIELIFYDFISKKSNVEMETDIINKINFFKNINTDLLFHSNLYKPQCKLRMIVIYLFMSNNMKFY